MLLRTALLLALTTTATAHAAEEVQENWQLKGQATYVGQKSKNFRSAYSDKNSLNADGESAYTFTSTAFLGARLWKGAEAYLNIEAGQGDAMSGLTGLGGFSNGEATRVSGQHHQGPTASACSCARPGGWTRKRNIRNPSSTRWPAA